MNGSHLPADMFLPSHWESQTRHQVASRTYRTMHTARASYLARTLGCWTTKPNMIYIVYWHKCKVHNYRYSVTFFSTCTINQDLAMVRRPVGTHLAGYGWLRKSSGTDTATDCSSESAPVHAPVTQLWWRFDGLCFSSLSFRNIVCLGFSISHLFVILSIKLRDFFVDFFPRPS